MSISLGSQTNPGYVNTTPASEAARIVPKALPSSAPKVTKLGAIDVVKGATAAAYETRINDLTKQLSESRQRVESLEAAAASQDRERAERDRQLAESLAESRQRVQTLEAAAALPAQTQMHSPTPEDSINRLKTEWDAVQHLCSEELCHKMLNQCFPSWRDISLQVLRSRSKVLEKLLQNVANSIGLQDRANTAGIRALETEKARLQYHKDTCDDMLEQIRRCPPHVGAEDGPTAHE